ncbi:MAG: type I DNA topoisomerase [Chloroflexi bacterium]|nr:type I DNA topoisomerase [Chloroflexota bacterium]
MCAAKTPARKRARAKAARGKQLVIVESPAKAETIGRFLGPDYVVDASYGHVRDLPARAEERPEAIRGEAWAELGVNVERDFEPVYIVPKEKAEHVRRLKRELKSADKLLLATDEDREGESIGWHLCEVLEPAVPVERIVFHEVTQEAIEDALRSPRAVDQNLVEAQEARRILDRLFGYSLSPVLWRRIRAGTSAGRVQSVAVRFTVQRERERAAFRRAVYWDAEATLAAQRGTLPATLKHLGSDRLRTSRDFDSTTGEQTGKGVRLLDEDGITALVAALKSAAPWTVTKVTATPASRRPPPPFTTSTLQQEANRRLGFSARRTMQIAQGLYEGVDLGAEREGLITYMRTDSVTLSSQALAEAQTVIAREYGDGYAQGPRGYKTRSRNAQEAHEAIRPTHLRRTPASLRGALNRDQRRLYELIWQRTVASQMPDAQLERTVVDIEVPLGPAWPADDRAHFEARGQRVVFPGFLRAYAPGEDDERLLPTVEVGEMLRPTNVEAKRHETQPPPRYTEASLVRKLEEDGLGRPSTYASILSTIQDRGYVFTQGNALVPTFLAYAVTDLLERHFGDLVEPGFSAEMEEALDAIARGEADSGSHLRAFYFGEQSGERDGDGSDGAGTELGLSGRIEAQLPEIAFPLIPVGKAPGSDEAIVVRIGRFGPYLQRGDGGEGNTASLPPDQAPADLTAERAMELLSRRVEGPRDLGRDPESREPVLLQSGRYGPFVQRGPNPPPGTKRADMPRRASVPPGMDLDDITLEDALLWLSLPRVLGAAPEGGASIVAANGRYGPYLQRGDDSKDTRSLEDSDDVYTITLERALELFAQPKSAGFQRRSSSRALRDLGAHPDSGRPVRLLDGRFGPYVTDGATNASIPRTLDPSQVTLEQALTLIAERALAPKRARKGASKRAGGRAPASRGAKPRGRKRAAKKRARKSK